MSDATPTPEAKLSEVLEAAFAEEFEEFAATEFVRKAVRASIAGKVKRRSLLELGYAQGCKTGNMAAGLIHRGTLAKVLGLPLGTDWEDLLDAVQGLAETYAADEENTRETEAEMDLAFADDLAGQNEY